MSILFAILAVIWWIALWGLSDILTENWSREAKITAYISILVLIATAVTRNPEIIEHL